MRYVLKQKLLAWGNDYTIRDDHGADCYYVDGKALSVGANLSFRDVAGHELASIRQRVLKLAPTYEIYRNGALSAVVTRKLFSLLHHRFVIDVPGADSIVAEGNLLEHEYTFRRGDRVLATVTKQWMTVRDTYGIDIADGGDAVLVLASAVVIDAATQSDDDDQRRR